MNDRQRFLAAMTYGNPDRVPFTPGEGRESTLRAWHAQGLPACVDDYTNHVRNLLGMPVEPRQKQVEIGVDFRMIPQFEEKVLEHRPARSSSTPVHGTLVVQDWKGNICEISDEFTVQHLRSPIDFVTRSWIKCPVDSHADWEVMKRRYDPSAAARFPPDYRERVRQLGNRPYVSEMEIPGPFWQLREWLGFERLCMAFAEEPEFVREMIQFWRSFVLNMLERMFEDYLPDCIVINEDMAYKEKPMIGPEMAREFLLPTWRAWNSLSRDAGVPVFEMDSDGYVGTLLPLMIEAGFNSNSPLEVAAGNDLPAYSRIYGTSMAYRGGIDKRKIATGGQALREEIDRLRPVIVAGGYIPGCDHGIPANVPWPNFVDYCRLLAEATGWL
jgi:hypothetical protein